MADHLPSLQLLIELVQTERDKQLAHFDALDGKAGVVLAFSGLLITLAPDISTAFQVAGVCAAVASAACALAAFWPRMSPVLEAAPLRRHLRAEEGLTRLTVLDTLEEFVDESSVVLRDEGRRLGLALWTFAVAAACFAAGLVVDAIQG